MIQYVGELWDYQWTRKRESEPPTSALYTAKYYLNLGDILSVNGALPTHTHTATTVLPTINVETSWKFAFLIPGIQKIKMMLSLNLKLFYRGTKISVRK
jgi:hypothetical protein